MRHSQEHHNRERQLQAKLGLYINFDFDAPGEEEVAQTFTVMNKAYFQNLRYDAVMARDALPPNLQNPEEFFFAKAQLDGRIDLLTELIELVPKSAETTDS